MSLERTRVSRVSLAAAKTLAARESSEMGKRQGSKQWLTKTTSVWMLVRPAEESSEVISLRAASREERGGGNGALQDRGSELYCRERVVGGGSQG